MEKYACIEGKYRYLLGRKWDADKAQITFVMLNPSTADANQDDPTLRKCLHFAKSWDYGSLEIVNLFAYRATDPLELRKVADPVGAKNNYYLELAIKRADLIIVAWGTQGIFQKRNQEVLNLISGQKSLHCLGLTKNGHPCHPLYLEKTTERIIFTSYSL